MAEELDEVDALARDIEAYLRERPQASDTIEGIQRWWLGTRWSHASLRLIAAALELLVDRGVMKTRAQADGSTLYYSGARNRV